MYGDDAKFCSDCADSHCLLDASYCKLLNDHGRDWLASLSPLQALRALYKTLGGKHDHEFTLPPKPRHVASKRDGPYSNRDKAAKSHSRPCHVEQADTGDQHTDIDTAGTAAAAVAGTYDFV